VARASRRTRRVYRESGLRTIQRDVNRAILGALRRRLADVAGGPGRCNHTFLAAELLPIHPRGLISPTDFNASGTACGTVGAKLASGGPGRGHVGMGAFRMSGLSLPDACGVAARIVLRVRRRGTGADSATQEPYNARTCTCSARSRSRGSAATGCRIRHMASDTDIERRTREAFATRGPAGPCSWRRRRLFEAHALHRSIVRRNLERFDFRHEKAGRARVVASRTR